MTEILGAFTGRARILNVIGLTDIPAHELQMVEVAGSHSSKDEHWNGAPFKYWGLTDLIAGNGTQRGYYVTDHKDGRDYGTFEGKVTTSRGETVVEGTWHGSDGTGAYAGMKGDGTFKVRLTSPMDVECTWQGRYELAATAQAA